MPSVPGSFPAGKGNETSWLLGHFTALPGADEKVRSAVGLWRRPGYQALIDLPAAPDAACFLQGATYGIEAPFDASDPMHQLVFRGEPGLLDDLIQTFPAPAR